MAGEPDELCDPKKVLFFCPAPQGGEITLLQQYRVSSLMPFSLIDIGYFCMQSNSCCILLQRWMHFSSGQNGHYESIIIQRLTGAPTNKILLKKINK